MSISSSAVNRPVFTIMVTLVVIILGGIAFMRLPIDLMPDITNPTLSVSVSYGNASPEEMEDLVTRPLEEALSAVPGVEEVSSTSSEGSSSVRITFVWGTDLDVAANDVRDRLDRVAGRLPDEADRPTIRKFDANAFPILIMGASGDLGTWEISKLLEDQVKSRIERVPGVASMDIGGGLQREIHVNLLEDRLKAMGIPVDSVMSRIRAENVNVPGGTIRRGNLDVLVRTQGEFRDLDQLRDTVVAMRDGVPVRLREVASVDDDWRKVSSVMKFNGKPGVRVMVNKQSGANTVDVARQVLREVEKVNRDFPQISLVPMINTSEYISNSINGVSTSAIFGGLLAVFVLLFFLRNVRSTAVVATAIPVSIVATFALLYFNGFTLNLMTLGGLALGVGMLVDNAIVVLENIFRLKESGVPPKEAAIRGSEEVTAAVVASTLTTVAVFLPLIFVRGMAGVMFKQLSYVVGFALLCSLAASLTLVPSLAAMLPPLKPRQTGKVGILRRVAGIPESFFRLLESTYVDVLTVAVRHPFLTVLAGLAVLVGSLFLVPHIGYELMPQADEGEVRVNTEMEVGTRLDVLQEKMKAVEEAVAAELTDSRNTVMSLGGGMGGGGGSSGTHTASMRVVLKPKNERTRSSEQAAVDLRKKTPRIPGMTIRTSPGRGMFLMRMGTGSTDRVQIEIRGHDIPTADALADKVKAAVEAVPGITYAQLSRLSGVPEEMAVVDRAKAGDMKVTVSQVANLYQTVLTGTQVGYFREGSDQIPIRVQIKDSEKLGVDGLLDLSVTNSDGQAVPLRSLADFQSRTGPQRIQRRNQGRIVTVSADLAGRDMGSVIEDIIAAIHTIPTPDDFSIVPTGDWEEQQKAFRELALSFVLAILLVYMVMACQYESLRDPFIVMFSVPLAAIGVLLFLFLSGTTFNIQSFIGCIMLGGIVVNNAIILVDHTNLLRNRDKMGLHEAVMEAGRRRLRPILMTSLTTILALLPLAFGFSEGGEAQAPMARAVVGGLASSSLITLLFIPAVYTIFEKIFGKARENAENSPAPAEPPTVQHL